MFGKIKFISDNIVIVAINKDASVIQNLMNLHVVFENDSTKLLGEVKNIDEESIKIELLGEFVGTRFIAGTIKKPTLNSTIRVINNEELDIIEDLPVPAEKTKYFESIPYNIAKREGYKVSNIVSTNPRVAIYNSTKGNQLAHGYFFPKRSNERDLTNYVFLNNTGFNRSTMTHELNHKYVYDGQILPTELTSKQEKLITEAYPTRIETIPGSNTTIERRAVNEQLREEFVNEFYKRNGRYPEINSDRNELFEFLEKMPEKEFEEIIKRPYLRTRYLNDYLDRIGDLRNEELEDISFWKNLGVSKEPSKYWDSKMKYAIGNIPVMLGFGLYNNFNDERNDNWNSR